MWYTQRIGTNKRGQKGKGTMYLLTQVSSEDLELWSVFLVSVLSLCLILENYLVYFALSLYLSMSSSLLVSCFEIWCCNVNRCVLFDLLGCRKRTSP